MGALSFGVPGCDGRAPRGIESTSEIIKEAKAGMRALARDRVSAMSEEARTRADQDICESVLSLSEYRDAEQMVAYLALADEVCVQRVLKNAIAASKRVLVPVVGDDGQLFFARWLPAMHLEKSQLGVREPTVTEAPAVVPTLSLIPGRAFDRDRNRLGRGGGYYDRAMQDLERLGPTVGVGYTCQLVDQVPHGVGDVAVGLLVTDTAIYR